MHTKDKSVFTLPNGYRIVGFDSLEIMAHITGLTMVEFADVYGTQIEKLTVSRMSVPRKDTLYGRVEE